MAIKAKKSKTSVFIYVLKKCGYRFLKTYIVKAQSILVTTANLNNDAVNASVHEKNGGSVTWTVKPASTKLLATNSR